MNKASGGDGIPTELWQMLTDDAIKLLHQICQRIWKTQQWPEDWKRSLFSPIPKKGNAKECSNYHKITLISHASKVMLKILETRLQQYANSEFPDVQAGFTKGRGTRDQIANIRWIIGKARKLQKNPTSLLTMLKPLTVWITTNCGKSLKKWNTRPAYLTPEKSVCRSRRNSQSWTWNNRLVPNWERSRSRKYVNTLLINFLCRYMRRNSGLEDAQAGIKIARRNINNLRYADDTTIMAENEKEMKGLLMKVIKQSEMAD